MTTIVAQLHTPANWRHSAQRHVWNRHDGVQTSSARPVGVQKRHCARLIPWSVQYFLWRQSTLNDLQLILGVNFLMLIVGVLFKSLVVDDLDAYFEGRGREQLSWTRLLANAYGVSHHHSPTVCRCSACPHASASARQEQNKCPVPEICNCLGWSAAGAPAATSVHFCACIAGIQACAGFVTCTDSHLSYSQLWRMLSTIMAPSPSCRIAQWQAAASASQSVPLAGTVSLSPCGDVQILQIVFAQELPERGDSLVQQLFGLAVAGVGLASFALVIALVEQASNLHLLVHQA